MSFVRLGLPALIVLAGVVVAVAADAVVGIAIVAAGVAVLVANWWMRLAIGSQSERDREAEARERFSRTGRWPDERP